MNKEKKHININFIDFYDSFVPEQSFIYKLLEKHYHIHITDNPDYLFCSVASDDHLTKKDCIKILWTGENQTPDFNLYDYFPRDYEIKRKGEASARRQPSLEGKPAPGWTLRDADGNSFSLDQVRSRVVLLNLTGIGCGACHASIPFLRTLKDRFPPADFELIAIETWGRPLHSIRNYIARNQINYRFLEGSKGIVNDYRTGGAAPYFFLLDEHRIVRKVFYGYSLENSGREIAQAIEELLQL